MLKNMRMVVLCCLFCKCQMVSKDVEYTIEHKGQTIIVQRILGNATSANYIQVIINGERVANIREESIIMLNQIFVCIFEITLIAKMEQLTTPFFIILIKILTLTKIFISFI